jgi:GH24 family phage-related lysozyme (muramidase)
MNISDRGLDIIKQFEGYAKALPDGRCTAYQARLASGKLDVPTIGWGCTKGVYMGQVWTREQAEEGLKSECIEKEEAVSSVLKFIPNQNQFDAMVSLAYNIGTAGFARSSVLSKANAGDMHGAAAAFSLWNKAGGAVEPGLVRRRAQEAALFMEGIEEHVMPQTVDVPSEGFSSTTTKVLNNTASGIAGTGILGYVLNLVNMIPEPILNMAKSYPFEIVVSGCVILFIITEAFKHWKGENQ